MATVGTVGKRISIIYNPTKIDDLDLRVGIASRLAGEHGYETPDWIPSTEDDPGFGQGKKIPVGDCGRFLVQTTNKLPKNRTKTTIFTKTRKTPMKFLHSVTNSGSIWTKNTKKTDDGWRSV